MPYRDKLDVPHKLLCEPYVIKEWNWLKAQTPLISPDYFINIAYKEQEEKKNAKTD